MTAKGNLSGRRAEAARNDIRILDAARAVIVADPTAPVTAVAERAGVGIGALYRRYPSKQALLAALCAEGQEKYLAEVERGLADADPWSGFVGFLRQIVDANTHVLTVKLAGSFTPTHEHFERGERMRVLGTEILERAQAAGTVRPDITFVDLGLLLELVSGVRLGDEARTAEVRQRCLTVVIDGITNPSPTLLPGSPPTWEEQTARWIPV